MNISISELVRAPKSTCIAGLLVTLPIMSFAHSGGTDEYGCHAGTEPYHCHNGGDSSSGASGSDFAIAVGATVLVVGAIWYFSQCDDEEDLSRLRQHEGPKRGWSPTIEVSATESARNTTIGFKYRF